MKLCLFLFVSFLSVVGNAQTNFETHTIKSKELKEKRYVWVGLPNNYHKDSSYSVIYVLDAEDRFDITYSLTKELYENQSAVPELIVVGIPNINKLQRLSDLTFTDSKVNATGKKDTIGYFSAPLTGNGLSFLAFLENEVVPLVNKKYNTNGFNTLMGHSIGGYFCSYIIPIQQSFSAFQIYDASIWYNSGDALAHLEKELDPNYESNIFISKGTAFDGPREYVNHHLSMIDSLGAFLQNYPKLTVVRDTYEKDHNAMYMYSVINGLSVLFKDEKMTAE